MSHFFRTSLLYIGFFISLCTHLNAFAEAADRDKPIELVDNVKVIRQAFEGKGEMQVLTEKLVILPNQDIAKTNSAVLIKQAPKTVIRAKGMVFDKKNQTIKLSKRVKVHYERPTAIKPAVKPAINKAALATPLKKTISKTIRSKK